MMKETLRALDPGLLPEIGLLAFMLAFVLILVRVLLLKQGERRTLKHLPLDDAPAFLPSTNPRHADEPR